MGPTPSRSYGRRSRRRPTRPTRTRSTFSGTLVARASISGLVAGTFYYATDTALLYYYNGTVWQTVPLDTGWVALTLASGFISGASITGYTPAYRKQGDTVRLRGEIQNDSGSTQPTGTVIATGCPAPVTKRDICVTPQFNSSVTNFGMTMLSVNTAGVTIQAGSTLQNNYLQGLDGIQYDVV